MNNYQKLRIVSNKNKYRIEFLSESDESYNEYVKLNDVINLISMFSLFMTKDSYIRLVKKLDSKFIYNKMPAWYYIFDNQDIYQTKPLEFNTEKSAREYIKKEYGNYGLSLIEKPVEKWEVI